MLYIIVSLDSEGRIFITALGTIREITNRSIHNMTNISNRNTKINKYFLVSYVCK